MAKRSHYNPQFYLRGFTEPGGKFLWRYELIPDTKPIRMNVINAGVKRDYYAYTTLDGVKDTESVEEQLNKTFEQPANPVIEKIRGGNYSLNQTERAILARYMSVTISRVPRNRQRVQEIMPKLVDNMLQDFPDRIANYEQQMGLEIGETVIEKAKNTVREWANSVPDSMYLPFLSDEITLAIALMEWHFVRPNGEYGFLTADNPFIFTEGKGLQPPDGEILFPISQDVVLWALWKRRNRPLSFEVDMKMTREINTWIVRGAVQYVYSCCNSDQVADLVKDNLPSI